MSGKLFGAEETLKLMMWHEGNEYFSNPCAVDIKPTSDSSGLHLLDDNRFVALQHCHVTVRPVSCIRDRKKGLASEKPLLDWPSYWCINSARSIEEYCLGWVMPTIIPNRDLIVQPIGRKEKTLAEMQFADQSSQERYVHFAGIEERVDAA
jgi:hypothetical protein